MDSIPQRRCTKCGDEYPATTDYFHALKTHSDGLHSHCKQCRNSYHRAFRQVKPDPYDKEKERQKYLRNREAEIEYRDRYYQAHEDEIKQYMRAFKASHQARYKAYDRNREARKKAATGTHTAQHVQAQFQRQKGKCYWCGKKLSKYEVDHVVPLTRGGSNGPDNLVIAFPPCNNIKNDKV